MADAPEGPRPSAPTPAPTEGSPSPPAPPPGGAVQTAPGASAPPAAAPLLFGRWDLSALKVNDPSLQRCLRLSAAVHTGGRPGLFGRAGVSAVERLTNKLMRRREGGGKKHAAYRTVREAFERVHAQTKQNPAQVFVDAIANAGPREETVRLKYGGIAVPKAVDTSAQRRVSQALMVLAEGAQKAAFSSKRSLAECLAAEIISASKNDAKCFSIARREEKERMAKASR
ncbi:MAG: 30S ribosomal protein S7 [Halobacteria archaeon]